MRVIIEINELLNYDIIAHICIGVAIECISNASTGRSELIAKLKSVKRMEFNMPL